MTNIVVRKNPPNDPVATPDPGEAVRQREGMIDAGSQINDWMKETTPPPAKDFFDDLFTALDGTGETQHRFFVEATNALNDRVYSELSANPAKYTFKLDGTSRHLTVQCHEDKGTGTGAEKMNIGVPLKRGDLIAGGYINTILSDLTTLINAGETTKAKQYLLAVIFLNRCQ